MVISVELLDTLVLYIRKHRLFPELILLVVLTTVAQDVMVTDAVKSDTILLTGIGVVLFALARAYYLIRRAAWEALAQGEEDVTKHNNQLLWGAKVDSVLDSFLPQKSVK